MSQGMQTFPTLGPDEIMEVLSDLSLDTSGDLLVKPTQDMVRTIYKGLVEEIGGVGREELDQPHFTAMSTLKNPQLHEDAIVEMNFWRALQKLMSAVGVHDFSMKDVHSPDGRRTCRNLSAIINFAKFREEKMERYEQLAAQSEGLQEQRQQMENENASKLQQRDALRARKAKEAPQIQDIQPEIKALAKQITNLNKHQAGINNEIKELKAISNEYNDKIADDRFRIQTARQESDKLRSQIVRSPEKIKKQLSDMSNEAESERLTAAEQEERLRAVRIRLDGLHKVEKDLKKDLAVMDELDAQTEKVKAAKRVLKETTANILKQEDDLRILSNRENTVRRQFSQAKEKMKKVKRDGERALQEAQLRMTSKQQERSDLERTRTSNQARLDQNEAVCREMRENVERLRKEHDAEIAGMQALCGRLESQVTSYHEALSARMRTGVA